MRKTMIEYRTPTWFQPTIADDPEKRRLFFDGIENLDPITGYAERNTRWFEHHILPDFLNAKQRLGLGPTLLDIGCAYGYFTSRYADHFKHVIGIDFSNRRIADAQKHNAKENV